MRLNLAISWRCPLWKKLAISGIFMTSIIFLFLISIIVGNIVSFSVSLGNSRLIWITKKEQFLKAKTFVPVTSSRCGLNDVNFRHRIRCTNIYYWYYYYLDLFFYLAVFSVLVSFCWRSFFYKQNFIFASPILSM